MLVPLVLGTALAIIHYYSEVIHLHCSKRTAYSFLSFAAGVSVAYLFLYLLPELTAGVQYLDNLLFFFLLAGFTLFHLIEKYIYQHEIGRKRSNELNWAHTIAFFVYYFIVGIVLAGLSVVGIRDALLLFIPIALHSSISSLSLKEVHSAVHETNLMRILLSLSPLLGVLLAFFVVLSAVFFYSLLGFFGGILLYIVIRDSIPYGKQGNPLYFFIGAFFYAVVILFTQGI